jgi:hypothetical protein
MAFSIKNDEADALLRRLTDLTGESLTDAVALFGSLAVSDSRDEDEILGYDAGGLPA